MSYEIGRELAAAANANAMGRRKQELRSEFPSVFITRVDLRIHPRASQINVGCGFAAPMSGGPLAHRLIPNYFEAPPPRGRPSL
ncbi:MAG: hypothetical protein ABI481_04585 [Pyrinomonadaceae bacterium]